MVVFHAVQLKGRRGRANLSRCIHCLHCLHRQLLLHARVELLFAHSCSTPIAPQLEAKLQSRITATDVRNVIHDTPRLARNARLTIAETMKYSVLNEKAKDARFQAWLQAKVATRTICNSLMKSILKIVRTRVALRKNEIRARTKILALPLKLVSDFSSYLTISPLICSLLARDYFSQISATRKSWV